MCLYINIDYDIVLSYIYKCSQNMPNPTKSPADTINELSVTAKSCLEQAVKIPGAPLYHLGNIAVFKSKNSFELMQATIDYLTCKAQAKILFSDREKTFLIELFESFWWGGYIKGMPEAAELANNYVNGNGKALKMDSKPYEKSVVVQDTIQAMKSYIRDLANRNKNYFIIKTIDIKFRSSKYFKPLMLINGSRNRHSQGYVFSDGIIFAENNNQRLKKADHRFF